MVQNVASDWRYDIRRQFDVDGGAFQLRTARVTLRNGQSLAVELATYFEISDGKITRIEEYYDLQSAQPLMDAVAAYAQSA